MGCDHHLVGLRSSGDLHDASTNLFRSAHDLQLLEERDNLLLLRCEDVSHRLFRARQAPGMPGAKLGK